MNELALAQTPAPAQSPAQAPAQRTFRDVPTDYWAHDYIAGLAQFRGISGFPDGTFRPDELVTRAQFAAILRQAFLSAQPSPIPTERLNQTQLATPAFADVPNNYWARNDIYTARQAGFLSGYPGNQFKPNQPMPRVQALIAIATGLGYQGGAISELSVYHDAAAIPDYARPGIAAARSANIVVNHPAFDQLVPNRPATRAEVAAFVYQALVKDGRAQPVAAAGGRWQTEPITMLPTAGRSFSFSADGQRLLVLTTDETKLQVGIRGELAQLFTSIDELNSKSELIVVGKFQGRPTFYPEVTGPDYPPREDPEALVPVDRDPALIAMNAPPYRDMSFQISEVIKGEGLLQRVLGTLSAPSIKVRQMGAMEDGAEVGLIGDRLFQPGEEYVLFLHRDSQSRSYFVRGTSQGAFIIKDGKISSLNTLEGVIDAGPKVLNQPLTDFLGTVRSILDI